MSGFSGAFSAGAGFTPEEFRYLAQGVLGLIVFTWAGILVKGVIKKATTEEFPTEYFIQHVAVLFVVIVVFIAVSYW